MIGMIEQAKDIKQRALSAAGGTDDGMNSSWSNVEGYSAQGVHARFIFAEIAFYVAATERKFHRLEPRNVTTGGRLAARRAGT